MLVALLVLAQSADASPSASSADTSADSSHSESHSPDASADAVDTDTLSSDEVDITIAPRDAFGIATDFVNAARGDGQYGKEQHSAQQQHRYEVDGDHNHPAVGVGVLGVRDAHVRRR